MVEKIYLTRAEASTVLQKLGLAVSESSLAKYATHGGGPEYYKFRNSRVYYTYEALNRWAQQELKKVNNTGEYIFNLLIKFPLQ